MLRTTQRGIQVLRNACGIMKTTEGVTVPTGNVTRQYEELQVVVDRTTTYAREQESHAQAFRSASTKARLHARQLRRQWIDPISDAAKLIVPADPELSGLLRASKGRGYEKLRVVASSLADRVEPHVARFVAAGFNPTFVEDLRAEVTKLEGALAEKAEHFRRRSAATTALNEEYARGRRLVRFIDRMVTPVWEKTPEKLAEWKTASRFPRNTREVQGNGAGAPAVPVAGQPVTPVAGGNAAPDSHAE